MNRLAHPRLLGGLPHRVSSGWVLVLALAASAPIPAAAQQAQPAPSVDTLAKRIDQMESEIKALKEQLATAQTQAQDAAAAASVAEPTYPSLNFHGFGDTQYEYTSDQKNFPNRFWLGELDFYVSAQIAPNTSIISENVLSADPSTNNWSFEAERIFIDYKFNPYFNVVAGRFHTEIGYYNTAFHHGTWFEMDTHRPWFLEFEDSGGILPVHMVGVSVDGEIPSGSANLHYWFQVGNGRSYDSALTPQNPTQAEHVDNGRKAVNIALTSKPSWAPGFQFGAGFYHQDVSPQTAVPGTGVEGFDVVPSVSLATEDETIGNVSVIYNGRDGWTFLNEAFLIGHRPTGDTTHHTFAAYSEASKKLGAWTPYARFTYVNSPASDPVYNLIQTTGLRYGPTFGLRYDFTDYACLKLQYDLTYESSSEQEQAPTNDVTFQVAFTF